MSTALHHRARHPEHRIRIIERDILADGGSTRNAGFACFGGPGEWRDDLEAIGKERWLALVEQRAIGLRALVDLIGQDKLGLEWTGAWELFDRTDDGRTRAASVMQELRVMAEAVHPIMVRHLGPVHPGGIGMPVLVPDPDRAAHFGGHAAIRLPWEGMLHTGRMIEAFHRKLAEADIQCLNGCTVLGFEEAGPAGSGWNITTDRGEMSSRQVAICTNAWAARLEPELDVRPVPNRVMVVQPKTPPPKGAYHVEDGYLYFRTLPGGKVLFGGGRHFGIGWPEEPGQPSSAEAEWDRRLMASARRWLGPIDAVTHQWTGWLGVGRDRQPLIGSSAPGLHYAVRMGGMGVAMGCGLGRELAARISAQ